VKLVLASRNRHKAHEFGALLDRFADWPAPDVGRA